MKGKDINLFMVYKNGPTRPTESGYKIILAVALVFIFIISAAYSGIFIVIQNTQAKTDSLKAQIATPQVVAANNKLSVAFTKNSLLSTYNIALTLAQKKFDASRIIDSQLLDKIAASTPANTYVKSVKIDAQNVELTYNTTDRMAPAIFTQALNAKDIFSSITYNSIALDDNSININPVTKQVDKTSVFFVFTLKCEFKEVAAK